MNNEETVLVGNVQNQRSEETIVKPAPSRPTAVRPVSSAVSQQAAVNATSPQGDDKISWKKVVLGGVSAVALGGTTAFAANRFSDSDLMDLHGESEQPDDAPVDDTDASDAAQLDEMSFADAFQSAREELGPGGTFEWNGNLYSTYTSEEWDEVYPETEETEEQVTEEQVTEETGEQVTEETEEQVTEEIEEQVTEDDIEVALYELGEDEVVSDVELLSDDVEDTPVEIVEVSDDLEDLVVALDEGEEFDDDAVIFEEDLSDYDSDDVFAMDDDFLQDSDHADIGFDNTDMDLMV